MSSPPPAILVAQADTLPSRRASYPSNIPVLSTPTPLLLLKRLQQQKKKLAESSKKHYSIAGPSRMAQWASSSPANNNNTPDRSSLQASNIRPGSSMKIMSSGGRKSDVNRRIEGMGAREMDQYLAKIKKENFDLKLTHFHLRERIEKTENELSETQIRLSEVQARTDELTDMNEKLQTELDSRDAALSDAVRIISTYEEHVAELEQFLQLQQEENREGRPKEEVGYKTDERDTTNDGALRPRDLRSLGVSPFAHRSSSPVLTPLRPRLFSPESSLLSSSSNLIDLSPPPISPSRTESGLLKAAFLSDDVPSPLRSGPLNRSCLVLDNSSSIPTETPSPDPLPASPDPSVLDSPRLSVLSESSFASMYGGHEVEGTDTYEDNNPENPGRIGLLDTPISSKLNFNHQFGGTAETPDPEKRPSPRREMMEYIDRAKERQISGLAIINAILPPTPESISTTKIDAYEPVDDFQGTEVGDYKNPISVAKEGSDEVFKLEMRKESGGVGVQLSPGSQLEPTFGELAPDSSGAEEMSQRSCGTDSGNVSNKKEKPEAKNIRNPKVGESMTLRRKLGFGERIAARSEKRQEKKNVLVGGKKPTVDNIRQKRTSTIGIAGAKKLSTIINADTPPHTPTSDVTAQSSTLSKKGSWESISERSLPDQFKGIGKEESEESIGSNIVGATASNTSMMNKASESVLSRVSGKRMQTTLASTTLRRSSSFAENRRTMDSKGQREPPNQTAGRKRERQSLATKLGKGEWRF